MNRLFTIAAFVSGMLCLLCAAVALGNYRLFHEGTLNRQQQQIIHESWRIESAKRYGIAACAFSMIPLAWVFWPTGSNVEKLKRHRHEAGE